MSAVTLYRAADGELFETEAEQLAYDASLSNKKEIEDFVNRHFPIPAPAPVLDSEGNPTFDEAGKPVTKARTNNARGPVAKAIAMWISEHQ
jgi:hypothetical protein